MKITTFLLITIIAFITNSSIVPEVKVIGAMKNIMMKGNLNAYADLDTIQKKNLYALGPIEGLKGEAVILDGEIYSSQKINNQIINGKDKASKMAMLVYSYVENWEAFVVNTSVSNYAELETLVSQTAKQNGYDISIPFAFKIEATPQSVNYHIIDWKKGINHTMENHKQFAYLGKSKNSSSIFLGFYSDHHHSVFTHHTTNMHVHVLDEKSKIVGHLDDIKVNNSITIYLPKMK